MDPMKWRFEGWGFTGWGPNSENVGVGRVGARRVGARRVGEPKFRSFSPFSRRKICSFLPSLGCPSRGILVVFEGQDPQMCTFGLSGCCVKPRRPRSRRSYTRCHQLVALKYLRFRPTKTPPKFHEAAGVSQNDTNRNPDFGWAMALNSGHNSTRRPPRERRKNEIFGGREKKKSEILGGLAEGCLVEVCPAEG